MMIHEITTLVGKHKPRKRIGRGDGSGSGKTAGRGHKGAKSRAGYSRKPGFEGGQMPLFRRIPKRGFTNAQFRKQFHVINVGLLEQRFDAGAEINVETLAAAGIVRDTAAPLKILGDGELTKKFSITAGKVSESARKKIEAAGGTVTVVAREKWTRQAAAAKKAAAAEKTA